MPRHTTKTSFKPGENHVQWKGGTSDYWRREARKKVNAPKDMVVHHIDNNWKNNDVNNLLVISQSEHVAIHNSQRQGSIKPNSKIRTIIKDVLKLKKQGLKRREIAIILNVNPRMIKRCLTNEWRCQYESVKG